MMLVASDGEAGNPYRGLSLVGPNGSRQEIGADFGGYDITEAAASAIIAEHAARDRWLAPEDIEDCLVKAGIIGNGQG
jgi:hypothetical protein